MAKIISIQNEIVSIGTDEGSIKEVRMTDLNFSPSVGDEVEIFETENKTLVTKKEKPIEQTAMPAGGININMTNTQTQSAQTAVLAN